MDDEQEVESAKADLEKTLATQKAEIARLEADIANEEANLRLAELTVERMVFEATVQKEEAEIEAHKAKLSHQQAIEKLASQKIVNAAEVKKRQLNIERQERDLKKSRDDLASTTIKAEKPGLVRVRQGVEGRAAGKNPRRRRDLGRRQRHFSARPLPHAGQNVRQRDRGR